MNRESKTRSFQVKDLGITTDEAGNELGHIEAYGAIFDNVDEGRDEVKPGAFKRTIQNNKARAVSRKNKYIAAMLWQHDTFELIGGWTDLIEDSIGLKGIGDINLGTQRGREFYALAKAGMSTEFSIVYDIPTGGAKYRKDGVRELTELRLFSLDPVTFGMNDQTILISVKSAGGAVVCGNTSGPIGPRDESWDGSEAEKQIWAATVNEQGEIATKLASKYFMVRDGDGTKKGDYSYPFWYVGDKPHICVGAVKAIADNIQGGRGASAPDALKPKIATLYNRITAKYPDDPPLTPPWNEGGKGLPMSRPRKNGQPAQKLTKTFQEHYAQEQCADLLEDWQDVTICALTSAILDAFRIGDQPEADVRAALEQFNTAVMDWVAKGAEYGLSEYLAANTSAYSDADYTMQYGSDSRPTYGYMSRSVATMFRKAGRSISASNATALQNVADKLTKAADEHMKATKAHAAVVRSAADDLATVLQGSESAYGSDPGDPGEHQEGKSLGASLEKVRAPQSLSPQDGTVTDDELNAALARFKSLHA